MPRKKKKKTKEVKNNKRWIQQIVIRKGALREQLGIPEGQKIPMQLLNRILMSLPGEVITYEVNGDKKRIKVTEKLIKRARLAKTFKEMRE